MHAVDIYGLSEIMGPGVANECVEDQGTGCISGEDHFYPEIIDPVTGEVLPDGEMGELVFTTLSKGKRCRWCRYRTRDLTRLLPGHRTLDAADGEDHRAVGRHDHPLGASMCFRPRSRSRFLKCFRGSPRILPDRAQPPPGRMDDHRPVHVECTLAAADAEARAASARELAHHIKSTARPLGPDRRGRAWH